MTIFFRDLSDVVVDGLSSPAEATDSALLAPFEEARYETDALSDEQRAHTLTWMRRYVDRLLRDDTPDETRRQCINAVNPKYVLRNYLARHRAGCSMLSCSS